MVRFLWSTMVSSRQKEVMLVGAKTGCGCRDARVRLPQLDQLDQHLPNELLVRLLWGQNGLEHSVPVAVVVLMNLVVASLPMAPPNSSMVGAKSVRFGGLAKSGQWGGTAEVELATANKSGFGVT